MLGAMFAGGLGAIGVLLHLILAATWGRGRPNALATAIGPAVCIAIGVAAAILGDASRELQSQLDDVCLMIPVVGVIAWSLTSLSLWTYVRA